MDALPQAEHFDATTLAQFLGGRLENKLSLRIEKHLDSCETCRDQIERLEQTTHNDPLVGNLQLAHERNSAAEVRPITSGEIPGYRIESELGRGGMGVVYRAVDERLKRPVALKVILSADHASHSELQRFRAEAETIARLKHPGVVQIYEIGEHDGRPFLALELVEDGDLHEFTDRRPQPADWSAKVIEQLARAVHSAHLQGVVHRDLKPGNILLDRQPVSVGHDKASTTIAHAESDTQSETSIKKAGKDSSSSQSEKPAIHFEEQSRHAADGLEAVVKVTDFGVARQIDASDSRTRTGMVLGTPGYMAPEQTTGEKNIVGPPADVFAMGAILYELLTGRPPFQSDNSWETMRLTREADPVSPGQLRPGIPRDLETICLKCLSKEPSRRYATADDLAGDLRGFLNGEPIKARPISQVEKIIKWSKRRPALASLCVAVVLGVFGTTWQWQAALQAQQSEASVRRASQEKVAEDALRRWANTDHDRLFDALPALLESFAAERASLDGNTELLAEKEKLFRIRAACTLNSLPKLVQLWSPAGGVLRAEYSSNGEKLLMLSPSAPTLVDCATGQPAVKLSHPGVDGQEIEFTSARLSSDGQLIAAGDSRGKVYFWSTESGALFGKVLDHGHEIHNLRFSHDSKLLAVETHSFLDTTETSPLSVWNVSDGRLVAEPNPPGQFEVTSFTPDNRQLLVSSHREVTWWNLETNQRDDVSTRDSVLGQSEDGSKLAVVGRTGLYVYQSQPWVRVAKLADFELRNAFSGTAPRPRFPSPAQDMEHRRIGAVALSPDATRMAIGFASDVCLIWNTGDNSTVRCEVPASIVDLSFSPCGRYLATAADENSVRVFDTATGQLAFPQLPHGDVVKSVEFHPDGQWLLTTSEDGSIRQWELTPVAPQSIVDHFPVATAQCTPDGKHLVTSGDDRQLKFWTTDGSAENLDSLPMDTLVQSLDFSGDGLTLATAGRSEITIWKRDSNSDDFSTTLSVPVTSPVTTLSDNGRILATRSFAGRVECGLYDTVSGKLIEQAMIRDNVVPALSPDGRRAAVSGHPGELRLLNLQNGLSEMTLEVGHHFQLAAFSNDSTLLLTVFQGGAITLRDVETGDVKLQFRVPAADLAKFHPDKKRLTVATTSGQLGLYDLSTGELASPILNAGSRIQSIEFSKDGNRLLTVTENKLVRVWSFRDGAPLTPEWRHARRVRVAQFHPSGNQVVTVSAVGLARVWSIPENPTQTTEQLNLYCAVLGLSGYRLLAGITREQLFQSLSETIESQSNGYLKSSSYNEWAKQQRFMANSVDDHDTAEFFEVEVSVESTSE